MHENNSFLTLTYKTLPPGGTLIKNELTEFMRRLRHSQGAGIRFFGCGEYSPTKLRPHYHAIIFNWKPNDLRHFAKNKQGDDIYTSHQLDKIWTLGHTYIGEANYQSAGYVARYILSKQNGSQAESHYKTINPETGEYTDRIPEFVGQSLGNKLTGGIGKSWYDKFGQTDAHNHDEIIIQGRKYPVPRYYDKLLETRDPDRYLAIKRNRLLNTSKHAYNNTPARLKVRARIQAKKAERLLRTQHDED